MTRVDICASDDHAAVARLLEAIAALGGMSADGWAETPLGTGLNRFLFPAGELTVFKDAWAVDVAGPAELVQQLLAALADR